MTDWGGWGWGEEESNEPNVEAEQGQSTDLPQTTVTEAPGDPQSAEDEAGAQAGETSPTAPEDDGWGWNSWVAAASSLVAPAQEDTGEATVSEDPTVTDGEAMPLFSSLQAGLSFVEAAANTIGTSVAGMTEDLGTAISSTANTLSVDEAITSGLDAMEAIGKTTMGVLTENQGTDDRPFYRPRTFGSKEGLDDNTMSKILQEAQRRNQEDTSTVPADASPAANDEGTTAATADEGAAVDVPPAAGKVEGPPEVDPVEFADIFASAGGDSVMTALENVSVKAARASQSLLVKGAPERVESCDVVMDKVGDLFYFDEDETTSEHVAADVTALSASIIEESHAAEEKLQAFMSAWNDDFSTDDPELMMRASRRAMESIKYLSLHHAAVVSAKCLEQLLLLQMGFVAEGMEETPQAISVAKTVRSVAVWASNETSRVSVMHCKSIQEVCKRARKCEGCSGTVLDDKSTAEMTDVYLEAGTGTSQIFDAVQLLEPVLKAHLLAGEMR